MVDRVSIQPDPDGVRGRDIDRDDRQSPFMRVGKRQTSWSKALRDEASVPLLGHTGLVGGRWWQELGWRSRNMPYTFPVRLPDIRLRAGQVGT